MQRSEAYNTISEFGEKMRSPADFEYDEVKSVFKKTAEAIGQYNNLANYVEDDFIKGLRENYIADYYLEYVDLFRQILKTKNMSEQQKLLHEISDIKQNMRSAFETLAIEENPELADEVFELRLQRLKTEPLTSNMNLSLTRVAVSATNQEKCEAFIKKIFSEDVPERYRNKEIQYINL